MVERYYESLKKTDRLHLRNSHTRWVTLTLEHARYLRSIGCEILDVAHAVLFASLTKASQDVHPYRNAIRSMLTRREDMQRELAALKALPERTAEQERQASLCTSLIFLAKIR